MWQNKVSYEYTTRKKRFSKMFPEAYEFLNLLENIRHLNFHIGTAKNLHLYYKDSFLVYIKLEPPIKLYLSPNLNGSGYVHHKSEQLRRRILSNKLQ